MPLGRSVLGRRALARFDLFTTLSAGPAATLRGNAGFIYTDPDTGIEVTLQLNWPLVMEVAGFDRKRRSATASLDGTVREVHVTGSGVREVEADLRAIDTPGDVLDMLNAALDGAQLDYYTDLNDATTKHETRLVAGPQVKQLRPDRDRRAAGEYETRLRLRAISGTFDKVLNP